MYQRYRKQYKLRTSRINYNKYKALFLNYQRCKKKTKRKEKKLRKQLLKFLYRLLGLGIDLKKTHNIKLLNRQTKRINTIIICTTNNTQRLTVIKMSLLKTA